MHTSPQEKPDWSIPASCAELCEEVVAFAVVAGFGEFDGLTVDQETSPFHDEEWTALFAIEKFGIDPGHQTRSDPLNTPNGRRTETPQCGIKRVTHKVS